jgi:hypothetical protein
MTPVVKERWGDFVLSPDASKETHVAEFPARRRDFSFQEGESPFSHRFARRLPDAAAASRDPRVPWPGYVPKGEEFLSAFVLDDGSGAISGNLSFLRRDHPDVLTYATPAGVLPSDGSVKIFWAAWNSRPAYMTAHVDPVPVNAGPDGKATVVEDNFRKVRVRGHEGILRTWKSVGERNMYGARLPTVIINWWEDDVWWAVQSFFLTPEEALRVAESIRPVQTR